MRNVSMRWMTALFGLLTLIGSADRISAADWPQILGPNRNGVADASERISDRWRGPLKSPWTKSIGSGYAGVAIAGKSCILFHRVDSEEVIECLDSMTGKTLWKQGYPTTFRPQYGDGDGPLCTPTISQGLIVTYGAEGVLSCRSLESGETRWSRNVAQEFEANTGYFGCGSTPLIVGDRVIVNVGGKRQGAAVVAFDLQTGKTVWKQVADDASYSAPIVIQQADLPIAIVVTRLKCVGIDIPNGTVVFEVPFGARGPTVNGATPVINGQRIFLTSSYGVGSLSAQLDFPKFEVDYSGEDFFASQYATPVTLDGVMYGIDGRDDIAPADLKCFDPLSKKILWTESDFGYGTQLLIDGKLLLVKTKGELVLCQPNRESYTELARDKVLPGTIRALPAFSNGLLYVRDEATLKCINLRP